jgi:hypothetical protein
VKIQGHRTFEAPREEVWETVLDPGVLSRVLPGCEDFHEVGENRFEGVLKIKVGPVQGTFQGTVELTDLDPPSGYHMSVQGKGAPGFVDGRGTLRLEEADGGTDLHYEIDAKVGGRIASVGQRLLDSSARVVTRQALDGLEEQIRARTGPPATGEAEEQGAAAAGATAPPEAPSQAEFAAGFVKGLLGELIPPERRPLVAGIAAVTLLAIVLLLLRFCAGG